jgi:hypothetical protein
VLFSTSRPTPQKQNDAITSERNVVTIFRSVVVDAGLLYVELLDRLKPIKSAFHDHTDATPACLEGTRVDLLAGITEWMNDPLGQPFYWLNGAAGTGKTTVAHSVTQHAKEAGYLTATFFFSRAVDDRQDYGMVIPTLAYQLAIEHHLSPLICAAVSSDHDIRFRPVSTQAEKLLLDVFTQLDPAASSPRILIVLDALDECREDPRCHMPGGDLLRVILNVLPQIPLARLFITSRSDAGIERLFRHKAAAENTRVLALHRDVPRDTVRADIKHYLTKELAEVWDTSTGEHNPASLSDIDTLVRRADGLFIYARTVISYICDADGSPDQQLRALIDVSPYGRSNGKYSLLDELYTQILSKALRITSRKRYIVDHDLRNLLVALVLVRTELDVGSLSQLIAADEHECKLFLRRISAVLHYSQVTAEPVRLMHASFSEFLSDPSRCTQLAAYSVDLPHDHLRLAECCMKLLNHHLCYDICRVQDPSLFNVDIEDLATRLDRFIPACVRYACKYWMVHWLEHIRATKARSQLPRGLAQFCSEHLLHWIEVLSFIGALDSTLQAVSELLALLNVSVRFIRCRLM